MGRVIKDGVSSFPAEAKIEAGHQMWRLEEGRDPDHFKPIPDVGPGVAEIIIDVGDAFRVFFVAKFPEATYILHAFNKKTRKTADHDLKMGRDAYAAVIEYRRTLKKKS